MIKLPIAMMLRKFMPYFAKSNRKKVTFPTINISNGKDEGVTWRNEISLSLICYRSYFYWVWTYVTVTITLTVHLRRRVARIWKRGGFFERVRKVQTTLTRIFIVLESVSHGFSKDPDEISRKPRKFKRFFRLKSGGLQKKKKKWSSPQLRLIFRPNRKFKRFFSPKSGGLQQKKKSKRSSPKLRLIFRPNSEIQTFEGGLFSFWGGYFQFLTKNRPQKHQKRAILHTSQANGGLGAPRPPWLRYCT